MRPVYVTQTGVGSTAVVPTDIFQNPFNVGLGAVVTGTVNYTVQHTFDDIWNPAVTPTWFPHPTIASETANENGSYDFPVRGIRLTVNSGDGSVTLGIVQSGAGVG